ncbi:hypothetical protein IHE44_0003961 [Lamprotornis superbus]|uniref:Uncharacterized protein n=1 Tax=Lamprotornis superbus TaxID=245042 RepID=A0A835NX85_9PASS|nr:hypothetical protein IHE44_0003961 [Lamprotornis superbus]
MADAGHEHVRSPGSSIPAAQRSLGAWRGWNSINSIQELSRREAELGAGAVLLLPKDALQTTHSTVSQPSHPKS